MNLKPGQITSVSEEGLKAMNTAVNAPQTILDEAKSAVLGSRHNDYGSCYPLYRKMADVLNALFAHKLKTDEGCTFTAPDMAIIQIVLKICREQYKSKRDNRVDIAGYAEVLDEIQQDIDRMFGGKNAIQDQRK
jgi:hypothetical protein